MLMLTYTCPSCKTKLAPVEAAQAHTQVVKRTCRKCQERWQLVVQPLVVREGLRMDKAEFTFLGRTFRGVTPGDAKVVK